MTQPEYPALAVVDRDAPELMTASAGLVGAQALVCDVSVPEQVEQMAKDGLSWGGRADALINNASVAAFGPMVRSLPWPRSRACEPRPCAWLMAPPQQPSSAQPSNRQPISVDIMSGQTAWHRARCAPSSRSPYTARKLLPPITTPSRSIAMAVKQKLPTPSCFWHRTRQVTSQAKCSQPMVGLMPPGLDCPHFEPIAANDHHE